MPKVGSIKCKVCKRWKGRESFPLNTLTYCRACHTQQTMDHRYLKSHNMTWAEFKAKKESRKHIKLCPACKTDKPRSQFYTINNGKDLYCYCRECTSGKWRLSQYGITKDEFETMLVEQNNCCDVCGLEFSNEDKPAVDHCHASGKVRGLLHTSCNAMIGQARERPFVLEGGAVYLRKHNLKERQWEFGLLSAIG